MGGLWEDEALDKAQPFDGAIVEEWRLGILRKCVVDGIVLDDATVALGGSFLRVFLRVCDKIRTLTIF